jgi:hypothetical protein
MLVVRITPLPPSNKRNRPLGGFLLLGGSEGSACALPA